MELRVKMKVNERRGEERGGEERRRSKKQSEPRLLK